MSRQRDNSPLDDLFDLLEMVFHVVPPWVSIPVGIIGGLLIAASFPRFTGSMSELNVFGWVLGGIFTMVCLAAGLKGWLNRRQPRPQCPVCGSRMVLRRARRGEHAGSDFWGCSRYPRCRGILNL